MKQTIEIGTVVDDGSGDYLRKGGQKINNNFNEVYDKLGDGLTPHPAGAWKTTTGPMINPMFGDSYAINTTNNEVSVNLPKGKATDYNKVIRLRDVWETWNINPVTIVPATGDTVKGSPNPVKLITNYMDVELVYCSPGRWVYAENKRVDRISTSELSSVAKKEYIAVQDQTDFIDIFGVNKYNPESIEIYLRGNLLYYGKELNDNSNYGSIGAGNTVVPLDGNTIRLRIPCNEGDPVTMVSYFDGASPWRSTYTRKQVKMYDTQDTMLTSQIGQRIVTDLKTKLTLTKEEFGTTQAERINPNSLEVLVNGIEIVRAETAGYPTFICEGVDSYDDVTTIEQCLSMGGTWTASNNDYELEYDDNDEIIAINFGAPFETNDVVTIKWFNNEASTTMDWSSEDGIKTHTDKIYLNNEQIVIREDRIEYTDYNNPSQSNMILDPQVTKDRLYNVSDMFDIMYPVGTLYKNAHNPYNPRKYMGFGTWVRYKEAEGRAIVGWDSSPDGSIFSFNNNDLDDEGRPRKSAGGTLGTEVYTLDVDNIPELEVDKKVLVADPSGDVIIGGCYIDPDATGPGYKRYSEEKVTIKKDHVVEAFSIIQPTVTAHVWLRVA